MAQQLLDPKIYGKRPTPGAPVVKTIERAKLSHQGKQVFEKWPEYLRSLAGHKSAAFYITLKQRATLDKSLGNCLEYTFDNLPIEVYKG